MAVVAPRPPRILLACSGSIATVKVPEIARRLSEFAEVQIVCTAPSYNILYGGIAEIYNEYEFTRMKELGLKIHVDSDEWTPYKKIGDPVLHIELRKWADIFLITPISANTLAKLANGMCDNLLTCVARAWDLKNDPLLIAPAMNTMMWDHPITARHLATVEEFGITVIPCVVKLLACGDFGSGAMAEVETIVSTVKLRIQRIITENPAWPIGIAM